MRSFTLTSVLLFASSAKAATIIAASCASTDVQSAMALANDGDRVVVPPGNCTWSAPVTVSRALVLDGQGGATITFATGGGLAVNAGTAGSTAVTAFTFVNGFVNGGFPVGVSTQSSPFNVPFRIDDNRFEDTGAQGGPVTFIGVQGFGPGLIDHNTFTTAAGADEVVHLLGSGTTSDTSGWANDVVPGGPNMTFLENNVFTNTSSGVTSSAEESYYGAQFVFRHNHLSFEGNDVHQGGLAGRWAEIYANTYAVTGVTNNLPDYWQFRGGSGLVYGNVASGTPCCQDPYPGAQFGPDCPSSDVCAGPWPIPTQVGTGIQQTTNSPAYVWGNTATVNGAAQDIQSGLDYTNGTQAGPTPTSCTHPGNLCDVVSTTNAPSTWVRCESAADLDAGCPVTYAYSAYPYPHPLDNLPASCFGAGCAITGSDAGTDAGTSPGDGGNAADGGTDGGSALSDAGTGSDAGTRADAGSAADAGTTVTGTKGCGCGAGPSGLFALLAALGMARGRKGASRGTAR